MHYMNGIYCRDRTAEHDRFTEVIQVLLQMMSLYYSKHRRLLHVVLQYRFSEVWHSIRF